MYSLQSDMGYLMFVAINTAVINSVFLQADNKEAQKDRQLSYYAPWAGSFQVIIGDVLVSVV